MGATPDLVRLGSGARQFISALLLVAACVGVALGICVLLHVVLPQRGFDEVGSVTCVPLVFAAPILGGFLAARRARLPFAALALVAVFAGLELLLWIVAGADPLPSDWAVNLMFHLLMFLLPGLLAALGRRTALDRRYAIPPPPGGQDG